MSIRVVLALGCAMLSETALADSVAPVGWHLSGSNPKDFQADRDTGVHHGGQASASVWSVKEQPKGYSTLMQGFRCGDYRGKRVRLTGWVKTQDAYSARLWMRIDTFLGTGGFDNMQARPLRGTKDWTELAIVLDVPEEAVGISFGLVLEGSGKAWVDDARIDIVTTKVPVTAHVPGYMPRSMDERRVHERMIAGYAEKPTMPVNLDFEQITPDPAATPAQ